jgi:hypothetical protein
MGEHADDAQVPLTLGLLRERRLEGVVRFVVRFLAGAPSYGVSR